MQTPTMAGGRYRHGGPSWLPSVRHRGLSAEASAITRPEITCPLACPGLQARHHRLAPVVLVRFGRLRRSFLDPFPAMAFFAEAFDGCGTDALARLLRHRFDDLLNVFRGVVEILIHFLLLFSREESRTAAPGTIIEPD